MHPRLPLALFALIVWSGQRLLSKVALSSLGTEKFYLLSAVVSLITYTPYLLFRPPGLSELAPAFGLACLMAITFGVTTVAIRRGPLGAVSPLTALSPALTALLAVTVLRERLGWIGSKRNSFRARSSQHSGQFQIRIGRRLHLVRVLGVSCPSTWMASTRSLKKAIIPAMGAPSGAGAS